MVASGGIDKGEIAANYYLAVGLDCESKYWGVGTNAGIEFLIDGAVVVEPGDVIARQGVHGDECSHDQQLAVCADKSFAEGIDGVIGARTRVEGSIDCAVEGQTGYVIAIYAINRSEAP